MITILSRDAVFSRMLELSLADLGRTRTLSSLPPIKDGIIICDIDSIEMPQGEELGGFASCILVSREMPDGEYMGFRVLHRPFSYEAVRGAVSYPDTLQTSHNGGELLLDPGRFSVTVSGNEVILSPMEFSLLDLLLTKGEGGATLEECGALFCQQGSNVIQVYVHYLRKKLDRLPHAPKIKTLRGQGYALIRERNKN